MDVRCLVPAGAVLGEGALWDVAEQALYWVDIKGRRMHRFDPRRDALTPPIGRPEIASPALDDRHAA
jgi:sugar lactone lactonase YvrE